MSADQQRLAAATRFDGDGVNRLAIERGEQYGRGGRCGQLDLRRLAGRQDFRFGAPNRVAHPANQRRREAGCLTASDKGHDMGEGSGHASADRDSGAIEAQAMAFRGPWSGGECIGAR